MYAYLGPIVWVYTRTYIIMLFDMHVFVLNVWVCFSYFIFHCVGHFFFQFHRTGETHLWYEKWRFC